MADVLPIVEFSVVGPALSFRSKRRDHLRLWQSKIADASKSVCGGTRPHTGPIHVRVTEFSEGRRRGDRDNIAKPILDAMEGIVYVDDQQVAHVQSDWADINGLYRVRYISLVVAAALSFGTNSYGFAFFHILRGRP